MQQKLALDDILAEIKRRENAYVKNWLVRALILPFVYASKAVFVLLFSIILLIFSPLIGFNKTSNHIIGDFSEVGSDLSHEISRIAKSKRPY